MSKGGGVLGNGGRESVMKMTYPHTFSYRTIMLSIFMTTFLRTTNERRHKHALIPSSDYLTFACYEPNLLYFDRILFRTNGVRLHCFPRCINETQDKCIRTSRLKLQSQGGTKGLMRTKESPLLAELTHVPRVAPTCGGPLLRSVRHVGARTNILIVQT